MWFFLLHHEFSGWTSWMHLRFFFLEIPFVSLFFFLVHVCLDRLDFVLYPANSLFWMVLFLNDVIYCSFISLTKFFILNVSFCSLFSLLDYFPLHFGLSFLVFCYIHCEESTRGLIMDLLNLCICLFESYNLYDYKAWNFWICMIIKSLKKWHPDFFLRHLRYLCSFRFPYKLVEGESWWWLCHILGHVRISFDYPFFSASLTICYNTS